MSIRRAVLERLERLEADPPRPKTVEEMDYWELAFALKHGRAPRNEAERVSVASMTEAELDALVASAKAEIQP